MDTGVSAEERQPASKKTSPGAALCPAWPLTHSSWSRGVDALPFLGSGLWWEDSGGHSGAGVQKCCHSLPHWALWEHCKAGLTVLGLGYDLLKEPKANSNRVERGTGVAARMLGAKAS